MTDELKTYTPKKDFLELQALSVRKETYNTMCESISGFARIEDVAKPIGNIKVILEKLNTRCREKLVERRDLVTVDRTLREWSTESFGNRADFEKVFHLMDKRLKDLEAASVPA